MRTMVIGDLHEPFEYDYAFPFVKKKYKEWRCKRIINVGDLLDHHRIGRHTSEPDSDGAEEERIRAIWRLRRWYREFPKMDIILGNHDLIPYRQAKEIGIPASYLRKLTDVYKMPKGWKFHKRLVIDGVLYTHELPSSITGAINEAKKKGMSIVGGHIHTAGGCQYFKNDKEKFFGLNVACLINEDTYAMRYTNSNPTLGCGVVINREEAYYLPCNK